jgi:hypothetical protein
LKGDLTLNQDFTPGSQFCLSFTLRKIGTSAVSQLLFNIIQLKPPFKKKFGEMKKKKATEK